MLLTNRKLQDPINVIAHTNARLETWYENAKEYGVDGIGSANIIDDYIVILYTENGRHGKFIMGFRPDEDIAYTFNVWMELADMDEDEIK